jgi:2-oxoglutarate ferredoxin oxidoreductase subunit alpha
VREVERAAGDGSKIHFVGKCGELPSVRELLGVIEAVANDRPLTRQGWELEAW